MSFNIFVQDEKGKNIKDYTFGPQEWIVQFWGEIGKRLGLQIVSGFVQNVNEISFENLDTLQQESEIIEKEWVNISLTSDQQSRLKEGLASYVKLFY
mgnify:CR=1 FL=1